MIDRGDMLELTRRMTPARTNDQLKEYKIPEALKGKKE